MAFNLLAWIKQAFGPAQVEPTSTPIIHAKPLWEQFQRIGGGLSPLGVSEIIRAADGGQPDRLVDLMNESRQKDGHLQGVLSTRERAPALVDLEFVVPKDASPKEQEAADLCRRIRDDFENWPELISHMNGFLFGHATSELLWKRTSEGLLLPYRAKPVHARDFIFALADGSLRYRKTTGDTVGVDLLAEFPGRIIQIQRRIVGDVPAREGLARLLVWSALLRNWGLRDWIALAEIAWKPWRIGKYKPGTHIDDIDKLVTMLERVGTEGIGVCDTDTQIDVHYPKGSAPSPSTHRELFDTLGREMSKAILGQTTTTESTEHGDQRGAVVRDQVRTDIGEEDCRAIAAGLRYCMFMPAVALNVGADIRCPAAVFQTDEGTDISEFATAINTLRIAGLKIPAPWVRDQVGMPQPGEDEELVNENSMVAEDARTLAFMSRAFLTGGYRVKNLQEIADGFGVEIEEDLSLLEAAAAGGEAAAE